MSQTNLSKLSGVRQQYISEMYNEMNDNISLEKLERICNVLECDVGDILVIETEEIRKRLAKPGR
jgi:putative transcriptional regulator